MQRPYFNGVGYVDCRGTGLEFRFWTAVTQLSNLDMNDGPSNEIDTWF